MRGFVINKLRGDPALLFDGTARARGGVRRPDARGAAVAARRRARRRGLARARRARAPPARRPPDGRDDLDVAVVRFPRLSNFTDLDALGLEPGVGVRFVDRAAALGTPDLIVLPGSKATLADLAWLRERGLDRAVVAAANDPAARSCSASAAATRCSVARSPIPTASRPAVRRRSTGLGLLDVETTFRPEKVTRQRRGTALGRPLTGYQIHHGTVHRLGADDPWLTLDDEWGTHDDGAAADDGRILGTTVHGLFEGDDVRAAILAHVAARRGRRGRRPAVSFAAAPVDRVADARGAPRPRPPARLIALGTAPTVAEAEASDQVRPAPPESSARHVEHGATSSPRTLIGAA